MQVRPVMVGLVCCPINLASAIISSFHDISKSDFMNYPILDNPAWHSLQTKHSIHALGTNSIQRYPPGMLRMLACQEPVLARLQDIEPWVKPGEKLIVIGELPQIPPHWSVYRKLECLQMVGPKQPLSVRNIPALVPLSHDLHQEQMLDLVNLVQPGYFYQNTPLLGQYFGIMEQNQLVAIAGERLCMDGFTEISAVCTHPGFTGKGFARDLITQLVNKNITNQTIPFLHVVSTNNRAIAIYESLGFKIRRQIPFWELLFDK